MKVLEFAEIVVKEEGQLKQVVKIIRIVNELVDGALYKAIRDKPRY